MLVFPIFLIFQIATGSDFAVEPDLSFYWFWEPFVAPLFEIDTQFQLDFQRKPERPYARSDEAQKMVNYMFSDDRRKTCQKMNLDISELTHPNWEKSCIDFQWVCRADEGCTLDRNDLLAWSEVASKEWFSPLNCMRYSKLGVGDHLLLYPECADVDVRPFHESLNYFSSPEEGPYHRAFAAVSCLECDMKESSDFMVVGLMCGGTGKPEYMMRPEMAEHIGSRQYSHDPPSPYPTNLGRGPGDMLGRPTMRKIESLISTLNTEPYMHESEFVVDMDMSPLLDQILTREVLESCDSTLLRETGREVTQGQNLHVSVFKTQGPIESNLGKAAEFWLHAGTCLWNQHLPNDTNQLRARPGCEEISPDIIADAHALWYSAEIYTDTYVGKSGICTAVNCMDSDTGLATTDFFAVCVLRINHGQRIFEFPGMCPGQMNWSRETAFWFCPELYAGLK